MIRRCDFCGERIYAENIINENSIGGGIILLDKKKIEYQKHWTIFNGCTYLYEICDKCYNKNKDKHSVVCKKCGTKLFDEHFEGQLTHKDRYYTKYRIDGVTPDYYCEECYKQMEE